MDKKERYKLCSYCDGNIPIEATRCIYCSEYCDQEQKREERHRSLNESLSSMYAPPYVAKTRTHAGVPDSVGSSLQQKEVSEVKAASVIEIGEEYTIWSMLFLFIGSHLFTIGWLLFFFSDRGKLVLEWKSRYWFLYVATALPLLYYGLHSLWGRRRP